MTRSQWRWSWGRRKLLIWIMYKRGKAMFAQEVVCAPPSSIAALSVAFNAAGFCQIQSQWWGCSITTVTMMGKWLMMTTTMPSSHWDDLSIRTVIWILPSDALFSVQMYFSCISNVFLIWAYPISCLACLCLLYQMVKIQCVAFHRCSSIVSFETGLTSASARWWWLWRLKWRNDDEHMSVTDM